MNANEDTACKTEDKLKTPGKTRSYNSKTSLKAKNKRRGKKTSDTPQKIQNEKKKT